MIKLFLLILLNSHLSFTDSSNTKACEVVVKHLAVVNDYLQEKSFDSSTKIVGTISFLERLTSIQSESDGNLFGKFRPTNADYVKWSHWYAVNNKYLFWDEKFKLIFIYKKVEVPQ